MDFELVGLMFLMFAVVAVPLSIMFLADTRALKREEHIIRRIDRIEEIENKYHVEISDSDLEMR